ncbi:MAG: AAA family ATPase [Polyangiaceae bacterium]|nr:AAA family ATPase [Polyangiaceae bacterium]
MEYSENGSQIGAVMTFVPAIGESDFRKLRLLGAGYVDKTDFIGQVLSDLSPVLLFPRPRRFGKTINLSSLAYFLRKTDENLTPLFEGLKVSRDAAAMAHFQKYPTIFITFKDVKATTFDKVLEGIGTRVAELYREHQYLLDDAGLGRSMTMRLEKVLQGAPSQRDLEDSLWVLSTALYEHHKTRVVILIDEYDTPIQSGYVNGYFDDVVLFFRNFLSAALKDNSALYKGVLTGILRVAKENMFSGLNNIVVHSLVSNEYATSFGFTEDEVASIVPVDRLAEVRAWYNGYVFGGQVIYNPWSILNYIKKGTLEPYWVNTSSNDLIEHLATKQGLGLSALSAALLNGETIHVLIDDNIVLRDIDRQRDALWNFLLFSGYLKLAKLTLREGRYRGDLAIPNKEIYLVYENMFGNWLHQAAAGNALVDELVQALINGNAPKVQKLFESLLLSAMSFQDPAGRQPEKLYHGFILGLLVHLESTYEVRSNRESGYGRADVLMRPKIPGQPGIVMELKVLHRGDTPEEALAEAAEQIRERQYAAELRNAGVHIVHEYTLLFDGKQAWVRRVEAQ